MTNQPEIRKLNTAIVLGAGNLAWHLGHSLVKNDIKVIQIYNRDHVKGKELAGSLGSEYTDSVGSLSNADLYIIAVSDDAIAEIAASGSLKDRNMVVHVAGGIDISVLSGAKNFGVLYPLQTFTKDKPVNFSSIPILVEANKPQSLLVLKDLAMKLSERVYIMDSNERMYLHLAAVISSNFTNHLFSLSDVILREKNLSFDLLKPLIQETITKAFQLSPILAQTGPALRNNNKVMAKHMSLLDQYPDIRSIYRIMSESISKMGTSYDLLQRD